MEKIYCSECNYFIKKVYYSGRIIYGCHKFPIIKDTFEEQELIYDNPEKLNKNNDCSLFSAIKFEQNKLSFFKKVYDLFRWF